ncbi:hypothetical protein [Fulvivirga ligni]|uniref:hypothetical protein n=1 Tax=Fulvivirga ligni TaxID=2904246 RepID=UPI001F20979F|nr:hypothetical protein [Fulvivirga ligni]UII19690.1 hypothetical protein LVD16_17760 [Fulvivirga ligni]
MDILEKLKTVSIRGRVAFVIHCIQNIPELTKQDDTIVTLILSRAWEFVEGNNIIGGYENFLDVTPECILDPKVDISELNTINEETYYSLNSLFTSLPGQVNKLIDNISYIMCSNLYSRVDDYSAITLTYLSEVILLMIENQWALPEVSIFFNSSIEDNEGWGFPTDRKKFHL